MISLFWRKKEGKIERNIMALLFVVVRESRKCKYNNVRNFEINRVSNGMIPVRYEAEKIVGNENLLSVHRSPQFVSLSIFARR
jgi:hypothetical protein